MTLEATSADVAFLVALGHLARTLESASPEKTILATNLRITRHPLAISQAHLRAIVSGALDLCTPAPGTLLQTLVALAFHGLALPAGTVLFAILRGAFHVLALAPRAGLFAFVTAAF